MHLLPPPDSKASWKNVGVYGVRICFGFGERIKWTRWRMGCWGNAPKNFWARTAPDQVQKFRLQDLTQLFWLWMPKTFMKTRQNMNREVLTADVVVDVDAVVSAWDESSTKLSCADTLTTATSNLSLRTRPVTFSKHGSTYCKTTIFRVHQIFANIHTGFILSNFPCSVYCLCVYVCVYSICVLCCYVSIWAYAWNNAFIHSFVKYNST